MSTMYAKIFALKFQQLRTEHKQTQAEVAERLGCTQQAVQVWERGEHTPKITTLVKVSEYFNVSIDWLLGRSDITKYIMAYSVEEKFLLDVYNQITPQGKDYMMQNAKFLLSEHKESIDKEKSAI